MKVRVFECFAGYGSQAMSLKRLMRDFPQGPTFEFVGISEIDPYAEAAYRAVHGEVRNYGDISKIDWAEVPDFDCMTYSFPCQAISSAGRQAGFKEGSGTTSSLLWECRRAIESKRPRWLLMENVKALLQKKFAADSRRWREWLEQQGYSNYWQLLNAKDYGVPQNRERVFMVSILEPSDMTYSFPSRFETDKSLMDVLEDNVDESFYLRPEQVERIVAHCDRKQLEGCNFHTNFLTEDERATPSITSKYGSRETDPYISENDGE